MSEPGCYRVPLARYPRMSRFVLDWLDGKAGEFLPRDARRARPRQPPAAAGAAHRDLGNALVASNRSWGLDVSEEIRDWLSGETMAIIAGQQVNFGGGPLYTLAKLATLVKMRRQAEAEGRKATLFFWLATEDHDFNEVATLGVPVSTVDPVLAANHQRDLLYLRSTRGGESREAVGPLRVPRSLVEELLTLFPMGRPLWLREDITFGNSFAELVSEVLAAERVVLVDALLPELRRAGSPLFSAMAARWNEVQAEIGARSAALTAAGYQPQVNSREGDQYTLFYELDAHGNRNLIDSGSSLPSPERVSTSALTRPLLQDFVFRPDVFVGGPAEVSYYAQIATLHDMLDVPRPRVALRGHVLVAPRRVMRLLSRYSIEPHDIFSTPEEILARGHAGDIERIENIAREGEKNLLGHIEQIAEIALPADHALARSINRSIGHLEYHFGKLTERAIRGLVRKDRERYAAVKELIANFYPDGQVQDRLAGWFPFWQRFGQDLVERMVAEIEPDSASFKIIGL